MHLLDTDTFSHLHMGNSAVVDHLRELDDPDVAITIITRIESLRGRFEFMLKAANGEQLLRAQHWLERTESLVSQIRVLPVDRQVAEKFDQLRNTTGLRKIGRADLIIASIALVHQAVLVTRNLRHFRQVPQLRVVNWVD